MKQPRPIRFYSLMFMALLLAWVLACSVNPVTGKRELMLVSEDQEISMGREYDPQVVSMYGIYDDPELSNFISNLGQRIAVVCDRPNIAYEFKVVDSPVINAFAVPGGFVYFTRGILAYLNNEAEVAGVMGHEVGHIAARHSAKQISRQQLAMVGLGVGTILSEDVRNLAGVAQMGLGLLFLRFGRDAERQSDVLGVEYSTRIGYDAREMGNFFHTLDRMSGEQDQGGLPGWFSTHPAPEDRVVSVQKLAEEWQAKVGGSYDVNRDEYLRRIDGLVFGEDPRQGFVEENIFYHPALQFQFPIPSGWQSVNTPSQLQIVSSDQNAAIIFQLASQNNARGAADAFVTESNALKLADEIVSVQGLPGVRIVSDIKNQNGVLRVLSYFIEYDGRTYLFHGFSNKTTFGRYSDSFEQTMRGFNRLTNPQKLNAQPSRVRVKTVRSNQSLREALLSFGVAEDKLEHHSLMNGMILEDPVKANMLIKVIEK